MKILQALSDEYHNCNHEYIASSEWRDQEELVLALYLWLLEIQQDLLHLERWILYK